MLRGEAFHPARGLLCRGEKEPGQLGFGRRLGRVREQRGSGGTVAEISCVERPRLAPAVGGLEREAVGGSASGPGRPCTAALK